MGKVTQNQKLNNLLTPSTAASQAKPKPKQQKKTPNPAS